MQDEMNIRADEMFLLKARRHLSHLKSTSQRGNKYRAKYLPFVGKFFFVRFNSDL